MRSKIGGSTCQKKTLQWKKNIPEVYRYFLLIARYVPNVAKEEYMRSV